MIVEVKSKEGVVLVRRDGTDSLIVSDSMFGNESEADLLDRVNAELALQGHDLKRVLMMEDGIVTSPVRYYLRPEAGRDGIVVHNPVFGKSSPMMKFNQEGFAVLYLERQWADKPVGYGIDGGFTNNC